MNTQSILKSGLAEIGLELDEVLQQKMLAYLALIRRWNKTYNLTAITAEDKMVAYHLLDSLAVLPYLWAGKWLDVGCGAGIPGAILALARPDWTFVLLDSNSKKTSFVQQAAIELKIPNISVHTGRVEEWRTTERFDGIISRAFADPGKFMQLTKHLLAEDGRWAAMMGKLKGDFSQEGKEERRVQLHVPGLEAERSLVVAAKKRE